MQCTRHLPAMSNWIRMQWNMPTVDGLRLIEGQSNCSKGRACSCSSCCSCSCPCCCFSSVKYDRYYLHFFGILMHVLSLSLFPSLVLVLSSFVASQTHLLGSLSSAFPFLCLFFYFFILSALSLHMLFINLTSISLLNLSWGLKHLSSNSSSSGINLSCCYKIISFSGHKGQAHLLCLPLPFFQVQLLCK